MLSTRWKRQRRRQDIARRKRGADRDISDKVSRFRKVIKAVNKECSVRICWLPNLSQVVRDITARTSRWVRWWCRRCHQSSLFIHREKPLPSPPNLPPMPTMHLNRLPSLSRQSSPHPSEKRSPAPSLSLAVLVISPSPEEGGVNRKHNGCGEVDKHKNGVHCRYVVVHQALSF